jgi:hypothetical protein
LKKNGLWLPRITPELLQTTNGHHHITCIIPIQPVNDTRTDTISIKIIVFRILIGCRGGTRFQRSRASAVCIHLSILMADAASRAALFHLLRSGSGRWSLLGTVTRHGALLHATASARLHGRGHLMSSAGAAMTLAASHASSPRKCLTGKGKSSEGCYCIKSCGSFHRCVPPGNVFVSGGSNTRPVPEQHNCIINCYSYVYFETIKNSTARLVQVFAPVEREIAPHQISSSRPNSFSLYWSVRREIPNSIAAKRRFSPCLRRALTIISFSSDLSMSLLSLVSCTSPRSI